MIIEKSMHASYLSNTWLVADRPGGSAVIVDTGGPAPPILDRIEALDLTPTHILCTHHHVDHVLGNDLFRSRFHIPVCGHEAEAALFDRLDQTLGHNETVESGALTIRVIHTPGHTVGQASYLVNGEALFPGDTLFKGSVGGTRAPGHTTFNDLRHSIMERLMTLDPGVTVHPGHTELTTLGHEWENNRFIRLWRGVDESSESACTAFGQPAVLMLRAPDYDGGTKCQVRSGDGLIEVVPGSAVR
ncbi:MAG: MBL fold metallo-hydrolase [Acidobacteria bacterium]|uniref:MBL fold metallo-hydrolase n=1 Tax=Candidatus Polarisedimenticola svalbardensis TaxID=2886004 RepID=A0A8J7C282_9BACT|nr:MBL fold metallo-hydrolase [Candidatus Polarisedimenticola svalbardensis]